MLEPQTRAAFTEQLAPPPGFELVHAVGTTFTLDLATALSVPLSFASHRVSTDDDQLGILDAIRRAADRVDVFAQAGEISMGTPSRLVAFLEPMLHPVVTRRGIFHPKVWFLEFAAGERRAYRFLCASRNLTADRSWDVVVRLDGQEAPDGARREARRRNAPLATLLKALPGLAIHALETDRRERIDALAERWRTIEWELPAGVREVAFHAFGVGAGSRPELPGARALIISPFVTDDGLAALRQGLWGKTHLVSRAETLDRLAPASLDAKLHLRVLDGAADDPAGADADDTAPAPVAPSERLVGLHAKVVVVDRNRSSRVLLGSANATGPGWDTNVEVMVELEGKTTQLGVVATLEALGSLVERYETDGGEPEPADEQAARRLEAELRELAGAHLRVTVVGDGPYELRVAVAEADRSRFAARLAAGGIHVDWHLLSRPDLRGAASELVTVADADAAVRLEDVPLTDITPFVVLEARDEDDNVRRTIVLAELVGDPADRRDAIIASQLTDRASFVRLLTLMLELAGLAVPVEAATGAAGFFGAGAASSATDGAGLFEALLRAVAAGHDGLADAKRVIDYVATTDGDESLFPPGFRSLWDRIWAAHLELSERSA